MVPPRPAGSTITQPCLGYVYINNDRTSYTNSKYASHPPSTLFDYVYILTKSSNTNSKYFVHKNVGACEYNGNPSRLALMRVPRLNWNCSGVVPAIFAHLEYPSRNSPKIAINEGSIPSAAMPSIT